MARYGFDTLGGRPIGECTDDFMRQMAHRLNAKPIEGKTFDSMTREELISALVDTAITVQVVGALSQNPVAQKSQEELDGKRNHIS